MTDFFPIPSHVDGLHNGRKRNLQRWREIAAERDASVIIAATWRDAAIADGWAMRPTYAGEEMHNACTLEREGYSAQILTRGNRLPKDEDDRDSRLGGGEVHCWAPDTLQIKVPLVYPGWQYFLDAVVTCPHCHRGPNRWFFGSTEGNIAPVVTKRYHFAGRACDECRPALRAATETPGWCD